MKKFLSLVLALVMTMSLVTISAGAKEFTDDDTITYDEAINVISTIGVVDGYADGSFRPADVLTRGAAAKIICNLILGPTTAAELHATTAPYKDVPTSNTFAGYIAYCAKEGIISGYADGTFRPSGTLTGYAFMKMLLGALNYDAEIEGYTGANWSINVAKQALAIGLNKGLEGDFNGVQAVTRQDACLYAFNTLQADLVEYDTTISATINGEVVKIGSSLAKAQQWNNSATRINNIKNDNYIQFAEQYFNKLVKKDDTDAFGRPAYTWVYDKKEIGTYVDYTTLVAEYTEEVTGKDLYELITKSVLDDSNVLVYVDGVTDKTTLTNADAYFAKGNIIKSNTEGVGATGNGVLTQVFVDTDADEVIIAVINTYLAQAEEDYDTKNDEVDLKVFSIDNVGGKSNAVYVKDGDEDEIITVDGEDFAIEDVEEDDLFLVTVADGEIQTIDVPEIVSESTISSFKLNKYVTADGDKYDYADTARYDVEVLDQYDDKNLKELTYNVILDPYGYLIGLELNEDPDQYVFLTGIENSYSNLSKKNVDANVIFLDGTMDTVTVDTGKSELGTITYPSQANTWCKYTVSSSGVYTLKRVAVSGATSAIDKANGVKVAQYAQDVTGTSEVTIDTKHVSLKSSDGSSFVYGNDDTVYLNVELKSIPTNDGLHYAQIIDDVESVTVGVKNVKLSMTNLLDVGAYAAPDAEIYTLYKDNGYIIAAVTIGENEGISSNYAYITSKSVSKETYDPSADEWSWERDAIVNGEEVTLTEVGDTLDILDGLVQGRWYELKYDANGNVRKATPMTFTAGTAKFTSRVDFVQPSVVANDTVVLFTSEPDELTFKEGTLYTTTNLSKGFSVSPDVKVVVSLAALNKDGSVTKFDDVTDGYVGYDGLEQAIRDLDTNFKGDLSAILENGAATVIILNDTTGTEVDTGSDSGSTENFTWVSNVFSNGVARISVTANRPEYITDANYLTYTYDVYVNGEWYDTISTNAILAGSNTDSDQQRIGGLDSDDVVTIENIRFTNLTQQTYKLKVQDQNGKDLSSQLSKPSSGYYTVNASADTNRTFEFTSGLYASGNFKITKVEGATVQQTLPLTVSVSSSQALDLKADTTGYVVVTIDTTGLVATPVTYSVTLNDSLGSGATLTGMTGSDTLTINAGASASIEPNTPVTFDVSVAGTDAYYVTITKLGINNQIVYSGHGVSKDIRVNDDITIDATDVTVTKVPNVKVTNAVWDGDLGTITVYFDGAVSLATGQDGINASAITGATAKTKLENNGKALTITVTNALLALNDTIDIVNTELKDTYGRDIDATVTITLAADGQTTIA